MAVALAGCDTSPSAKPAQAAVKRHVDAGYAATQRYTIASAHDTWRIANESVDVTLFTPAQAGSFPLVVYLPGLGESSSAGLAWRRSWGEAGYAVFSAQPVAMGEAVWSSARARAGDFLGIAKDAFSVSSLAKRIASLHALLGELQRKQHSGGAGAYAQIDLSRIAIAGFDLGAQTAMIAAGENVPGVPSAPFPDAMKCVVALSPYADFSGMGLEANFNTVRVPVLSITGLQDTDPSGLVGSASVRRAPFQYMPPGKKYLLLLVGASHSLLSGQERPSAPDKDVARRESQAASEDDAGAEWQSGAGGRRSRRVERLDLSAGQISPGLWATQTAHVAGVTTAYLDATVKDDPVAWEWLSRDAKRWLGSSGDLLVK